MKLQYPKSAEILQRNRKFIPGGVVSVNRATRPEIVFERARGAYLWDADGNRYIDYHAGFAPHFLGHNDPYVTEAVIRGLRQDASLYGSGTTVQEGRLAELICENVPAADSVQLLNTGSEATYQAIRLARAVTGNDHVINMQGGYNGWHNDVSNNLMTPLAQLGPRRDGGEYPYHPISAGVPMEHQRLIHAVNFNDLEAVEYVCQQYPVAALITEPILQNIGIVHPLPGYLEGLRTLADKYKFLLIFDEVKTGFRHGLGGCSALYGVRPDLLVFGKAIANGYPMAALAGKKEYMDRFVDPVASRRVLLAGTYNSHPVPTLAAIATIERLMSGDGEVYRYTEALGARMQAGLERIADELDIEATVARQGSAFCLYFMDHRPKDWHDLAEHHAFAADDAMRAALVARGIYPFPLATKQWSISAAHTEADIDATLEHAAAVLRTLEGVPARRAAVGAASARED